MKIQFRFFALCKNLNIFLEMKNLGNNYMKRENSLNFYVEVYVYFEFKPTNNYDIKYN